MAELFASGRIVDCILVLMLLEGLILMFIGRRLGRGIGATELAVNLAAGAALLFALRAAMTGAGWPNVAMWLVVALVAHVRDLTLRWAASP